MAESSWNCLYFSKSCVSRIYWYTGDFTWKLFLTACWIFMFILRFYHISYNRHKKYLLQNKKEISFLDTGRLWLQTSHSLLTLKSFFLIRSIHFQFINSDCNIGSLGRFFNGCSILHTKIFCPIIKCKHFQEGDLYEFDTKRKSAGLWKTAKAAEIFCNSKHYRNACQFFV